MKSNIKISSMTYSSGLKCYIINGMFNKNRFARGRCVKGRNLRRKVWKDKNMNASHIKG